MQYMFTGGIHYGGGSNHFTVDFFSECSIQCVLMPRNYIYLGVQFLLAKCMTEASSEDYADQLLHFKCTSTHISHSWTLDNESNIHNPELSIRALQDNKLQTFRKRLFEEVVHPTRPTQAAMVSKCITFSKTRTYMTCPSHDSRLSPWWKWIPSYRREW